MYFICVYLQPGTDKKLSKVWRNANLKIILSFPPYFIETLTQNPLKIQEFFILLHSRIGS